MYVRTKVLCMYLLYIMYVRMSVWMYVCILILKLSTYYHTSPEQFLYIEHLTGNNETTSRRMQIKSLSAHI